MDYSYQITAAKKMLEMCLSKRYIATILAACPSSGKSTIIIHFLNDFFSIFPNSRVVLFTHNLNNLKDQMIESFTYGHVKPNFSFGEIGKDAQVQIGAISSGLKLSDKIDMVVFDEAHQFYLENMSNQILDKLNPEFVVGMTGTPSYFNEYNSKSYRKFGMHYISAEELVDYGIFSNVVIDIASGKTIEQRLENSLEKINIHKMDASKIMIIVKNQMDANLVGYLLSRKGRKVAVSTSTKDPKNIKLNAYRNNEYDSLVLVNKGIMGFSDVYTTVMIDLRTSSDIDCRSQTFARILRKHPQNVRKLYVSAVEDKALAKEFKFLKLVISLMERKNFISYQKNVL